MLQQLIIDNLIEDPDGYWIIYDLLLENNWADVGEAYPYYPLVLFYEHPSARPSSVGVASSSRSGYRSVATLYVTRGKLDNYIGTKLRGWGG
jgi:hypothetical protein